MYFSQIAKGEETQNAFPGGLTKNESFEGELALRYWVILGKFSSLFTIFSLYHFTRTRTDILLTLCWLVHHFPIFMPSGTYLLPIFLVYAILSEGKTSISRLNEIICRCILIS